MRKILNVLFLLCGLVLTVQAQIKLGAYYFDGWTGKSDFHLNNTIKDSFPERKPIWGWVTSTPEIMVKQIDAAADAGLSFFNFCWYYNSNSQGKVDEDPKNNALELYRKSPNKERLEYAVMVANHKGYEIKAKDWDKLIEYWCTLFKDKGYVTVDGKPLITFFSMETLIKTFGDAKGVKAAFDKLKKKAIAQGLEGVTIAAVISPSDERVKLAEDCGYDILTGYNMHKLGLSKSAKSNSISKMQIAEEAAWSQISNKTTLPQIPVATLNWDTRPLDLRASLKSAKKVIKPIYEGFSGASVSKSVKGLKAWVERNEKNVTKEKMAMVFAWNEYGEGAWLTPSEALKNSLLQGLKEGLK